MADAITALSAAMNNDLVQIRSVSQNAANINTVGYKREIPIATSFAHVLENKSTHQAMLPTAEIARDMRQGTLKFTGNSFDVALQGNGFLVSRVDGVEVYSRKGNLMLNEQGQLALENGSPIQGEQGTLSLYPEAFSIASNGEITQQNRVVGQLKIATFANPESLEYLGNGLYRATDQNIPEAATEATVRQGYLETSNVNTMDDMIKLIETSRHFETSHQVLKGYDSMLDASINVLGQF